MRFKKKDNLIFLIFTMILSVFAAVGLLDASNKLSRASAEGETQSFNTETKALAASSGTLSSDRLTLSYAFDTFDFKLEKNTSTNYIRTQDTDHLRCYLGSKITVSNKSETPKSIASVSFVATTANYANVFSSSTVTALGVDKTTPVEASLVVDGTNVTYSFDTDVYASSLSVVLSAQTRINSISVSYLGDTSSETPVTKYTVTFDYNYNNLTSTVEVNEGSTIDKPTDPTRPDDNTYSYTFVGWYTEKECTNPFSFDTPVSENITLYAKWNSTLLSITNITNKFKNTETLNKLAFSFNTESTTVEEPKYTLVTDVSDLAINDQIIIAATNSDVALSTTQNKNNRGQTAITKIDDNTLGDDISSVQVITLEAGTTTGTFAFNVGNGYLYAASSSSNNLKTQTTNDANGSWSISITNDENTSGIATIKAVGTNTRNLLKYNSNSSLFSCYGSGQNDVSIYKLSTVETTTTTYTAFNNVDFQFNYSFESLSDANITETGLIISKYNYFVIDDVNANKIYETYANDSDSKIIKNDNKLISFTFGLKNIPSEAYETELTSVAYIKIGEDYYFNTPKTNSVKSLLETYTKTSGTFESNGTTFTISTVAQAFYDSIVSASTTETESAN